MLSTLIWLHCLLCHYTSITALWCYLVLCTTLQFKFNIVNNEKLSLPTILLLVWWTLVSNSQIWRALVTLHVKIKVTCQCVICGKSHSTKLRIFQLHESIYILFLDLAILRRLLWIVILPSNNQWYLTHPCLDTLSGQPTLYSVT